MGNAQAILPCPNSDSDIAASSAKILGWRKGCTISFSDRINHCGRVGHTEAAGVWLQHLAARSDVSLQASGIVRHPVLEQQRMQAGSQAGVQEDCLLYTCGVIFSSMQGCSMQSTREFAYSSSAQAPSRDPIPANHIQATPIVSMHLTPFHRGGMLNLLDQGGLPWMLCGSSFSGRDRTVDMKMMRASCPWKSSTVPTLTAPRPCPLSSSLSFFTCHPATHKC